MTQIIVPETRQPVVGGGSDPILQIRDLRVQFATPTGVARAVDGVSLDLFRSRTLCLVGESGCGKSVTSMASVGLVDHAVVSGQVLFHGRDLLALREGDWCGIRGGKIAMIFQEPSACLHPLQSVGAQISEAVRLHRRISRREASEVAVRLLEEVRIPDPRNRARQYPHELSGGMKQRVMIAMALAGDPEVLIADEPTTALDVTVQADVLRVLKRIQLAHQLAILLITHDLGVVAEVGDDVAVMYAGRIVERASATSLFHDPRHPYTVGLLRSLPRLEEATPPVPIEGMVPLATDWPSGCRFRKRCPSAFDACGADPDLKPIDFEGSREVACWLSRS